jgi:hypothetical protein
MVGHRSRRGCSSCHRSVQRLDDALERDVPGAIVDDVELLAMLIVVIDDLDHPLGILELHLLLVVALTGNVLLAFLLVGRWAVMARLLLIELLHELLDLPALLSAVTPGFVH